MTTAVASRPPIERNANNDPLCIACRAIAAGDCENCGAPICPEHDSREFDDVMVCRDKSACESRINSED